MKLKDTILRVLRWLAIPYKNIRWRKILLHWCIIVLIILSLCAFGYYADIYGW